MSQPSRPAVTGYTESAELPFAGAAPTPGWLKALAAAPLAVVGLLSFVAIVRPTPFPDAERASAAELTDGAKEGDDDGERDPAPGAKADSSASSAAGASSSKVDEIPLVIGETAEVRAAQDAFAHKLRINDLKGAVGALQQLLAVQPEAAKDPGTRDRIVDLAVRIMFVQGTEPDLVFTLIATKMGKTGIDILYQLATTKGGSRAAKYAEALLDDARVIGTRGSDAVQIAWELRRTTDCEAKKKLFERAGKVGDSRTLGQLHLMNNSCKGRRRMPNACCFDKDPALLAALEAMKARGLQ